MFFQNISTCDIVFGNLLEISADVLLFAPDFQKRSTFGLLFGNLLEILPREVLFKQSLTYTLTGKHF